MFGKQRPLRVSGGGRGEKVYAGLCLLKGVIMSFTVTAGSVLGVGHTSHVAPQLVWDVVSLCPLMVGVFRMAVSCLAADGWGKHVMREWTFLLFSFCSRDVFPLCGSQSFLATPGHGSRATTGIFIYLGTFLWRLETSQCWTHWELTSVIEA